MIDESFTTDDQQDCVELLQALFSICEPMQEGFKNKISFTDTCQLCQKRTVSEVEKNVMLLDVFHNSFYEMVSNALENQTTFKKRCSSVACSPLPENQTNQDGVLHIREESFVLKSKVLAMQADIFIFHGEGGSFEAHKVQKKIVPMNIIPLPGRNKVLELSSVIHHHGGPDVKKGHFTADVKTSDNQWYYCDDQTVEMVDDDVLRIERAGCVVLEPQHQLRSVVNYQRFHLRESFHLCL